MPKPYRVLCTLPDGVEILEPVLPPTHLAPVDVAKTPDVQRGDRGAEPGSPPPTPSRTAWRGGRR